MKSRILLSLLVSLIVSFACTSQEHTPQIRTLFNTVFHSGDKIELRKLNFDLSGGASIRRESFVFLDSLQLILERDSTLIIEIVHHTDDRGGERANLALSDNRARRVYEYLLRKGVLESRMSYRGAGESELLIQKEEIDEETDYNKRE